MPDTLTLKPSSKPAHPIVDRTLANENQDAKLLNSLKDETPALPFPFRPSIPDQDYYRIGEDELTGCIRDAIKDAGRDRWFDLTSHGGWTGFLTKSRDEGFIGVDNNRDSNDVNGLVDWVRDVAEYDNPDLDPTTNNTETCASLVKRFTLPQFLDEIIVAWAWKEGHFTDLPPTRPDEHLNLTTDDNVGVIPVPKTLFNKTENLFNHTAATGIFPLLDNSTVLANSTVSDNSTRRNKGFLFPPHPHKVGPGFVWPSPSIRNLTFHHNWTVTGNSTHQFTPTIPFNSTLHGFGNLTRLFNKTVPFNSTTHGKLISPQSLNFTGTLSKRDGAEPTSSPELSPAQAKEALALAKQICLENAEEIGISGSNVDLVSRLFDQPETGDLLFPAMKEFEAQHGVHWNDDQFTLEFLKEFVQAVAAKGLLEPQGCSP